MSEVVIEMQAKTRAAVAWVHMMGWLHRLGLSRIVGRDRLGRWAIRGMRRLTAHRIRHVCGGGWGPWHRGLMSVESPDDVFWRFV